MLKYKFDVVLSSFSFAMGTGSASGGAGEGGTRVWTLEHVVFWKILPQVIQLE